jgi:hypothetical protein
LEPRLRRNLEPEEESLWRKLASIVMSSR